MLRAPDAERYAFNSACNLVDSLDREASRIGVTRQSIIKLWLVERLEEKVANK
jgi:hypothetical protein